MMALGFLFDMAWKSLVIAGCALGIAMLLRARAAERALVLRSGVAMLLALPMIMAFVPALEIIAFAAPEVPMPTAPAAGLYSGAAADEAAFVAAPAAQDDPTSLILILYLAGVALFGARLLAGLVLLRRWTGAAEHVECPTWLDMFDRVRRLAPAPEKVQLLVSADVSSPISWGWRRSVILIDHDTLREPEHAEAILTHEMAHVIRRDWLVLMLGRVAAILFWFNPLVRLLERELIQQAEERADRAAAERVGAVRYAETLLAWARSNRMVPANSIAPTASALGRRVRSLLDPRQRGANRRSYMTKIAALLCLGIAIPVAAMKLVAATPEPPLPPAAPSPATAPEPPLPPTDLPVPAEPPVPAPLEEMDMEIPPIPEMPEIPEIPDIGPEIERALAELPRIHMQASEAIASARIDEAMREAREAMRTVQRADIEVAMRQAQHAAADAQRVAATAMASGAGGMEQGARGMESGAEHMASTGERLRTDRAYREQQIARARDRGETLTHAQLIEAGEAMRKGADEMRQGAREMREAAARMRRGGTD